MSDFNQAVTVRDDGVRRETGTGRFVKGSAQPARHAWRGRRGPAPSQAWRAFWAKRGLRPEDRWVRGVIREHAGSLVSDKPDPSEAEKHVIEVASIARGCTALILDAVRKNGGVETQRGLEYVRELRAFLSLETKALLALGLARRAKPVDPLQAVRDAVTQADEGTE